MNNSIIPITLIVDPATGTLPPVKCDSKWGCLQHCVTTRHRCTYPASNGGYILDNVRVCGAAFCVVCNEHNDSESSNLCPDHNPESLCGGIWETTESESCSFKAATSPSTSSSVDAEDPTGNPTHGLQGNTSTSNVPESLASLSSLAATDTSIFMDEKEFFSSCLNEKPTTYTTKNVKSGWYRVPGTTTMLKKVKDNVKKLIEIYRSKTDIMSIPVSNKSASETILCKYIYERSLANSRYRSEINRHSHPSIWEFVKDIPNDCKVNILDQSDVLKFALGRWGKTMEAAKKIQHRNDFCRYIGILLHPDNRDLLDALQKTKPIEKGDRRAQFDDPKYKPKHIFENLRDQFVDTFFQCLMEYTVTIRIHSKYQRCATNPHTPG